MGINDSFSQVRTQILLMDPFPSLNKVYSLMIQEETQRSVIPYSSPRVESTALVTKSQNFNGKERPICTHCGKSGHTIEKGYKLHGFPPSYKFKGKPAMAHQVTFPQPQSQSQDVSFLTGSGSMTLVFTPEQYQQLLALIGTVNSPLDTSVQVSNAMANVVSSNASSMAVIDTGATDHVVCFAQILTSITAIAQSMVQFPNGEIASITHIGTAILSPSLTLHNEVYMSLPPGFQS
ncbi:hypothetical protein ACB092_05G085900 [Castanea dentata]